MATSHILEFEVIYTCYTYTHFHTITYKSDIYTCAYGRNGQKSIGDIYDFVFLSSVESYLFNEQDLWNFIHRIRCDMMLIKWSTKYNNSINCGFSFFPKMKRQVKNSFYFFCFIPNRFKSRLLLKHKIDVDGFRMCMIVYEPGYKLS